AAPSTPTSIAASSSKTRLPRLQSWPTRQWRWRNDWRTTRYVGTGSEQAAQRRQDAGPADRLLQALLGGAGGSLRAHGRQRLGAGSHSGHVGAGGRLLS